MKYKGICSVAAFAAAVTAYSGGAPAEAQLPPRITMPPAPAPPEPYLPNGTPVRISFAPPLGVPIRYRVTETKTRNGQPETKIVELVVRFERSGESYLMEGRVEFPGLAAHLARDPMVKIALRPVKFRLDSDGALTGIENEEAYWAGLEPVIDRLINEEGGSAAGGAIVREVFRKMRGMPAEEQAALVGRHFAHITARASAELAIGETVETPLEEISVPLPGTNITVKKGFSIRLASASSTTARFETESRIDPESMARFMRQLFELAPEGKRPDTVPEFSQSLVHLVARDTGLTISALETTRAVGGPADAPAMKIVKVERLQ